LVAAVEDEENTGREERRMMKKSDSFSV